MVLANKKLMILGGNPETATLVRAANDLGVITIVVDPNPTAPAKKQATRSHNVDGFDIEGLLAIARGEEIDGVLVGVADILVHPYQELCSRLELPCYASATAVQALTTKDGFRRACVAAGVEPIPSFQMDASITKADRDRIKFPVLVKPVDSGGGLGISVCDSEVDLADAVRVALSYSRRKAFIVERYMECDDTLAYYTLRNGTALLSAMADRITAPAVGRASRVCIGALYPSRHIQLYTEIGHPKLTNLLQLVGATEGVLCVQFFANGGAFYAYDPGYRLQGEAPHIHLQVATGINHLEMLIKFALGYPTALAELVERNDPLFGGLKAATVWVLVRAGTIARVSGIDRLADAEGVVAIAQRLSPGDTVTDDMVGTERQVFCRIYLQAKTREALASLIEMVHSTLVVTDGGGHDLITHRLDPALARRQ